MTEYSKYRHILEKALEYIEINIFLPLSTASIAEQVGFSEYHFQRIFAALIGDSAASYVRKRRLSEAAIRLRDSNINISDIAYRCQFGSQEAFTRAFSKMFGQTPGQYRQSRNSQLLLPKADLSHILNLRQGKVIEPRIIERQLEIAVGITQGFSPNSLFRINSLWELFLERKKEIKLAKNGYMLGILADTHLLTERIERGDELTFSYTAALPVESFLDIPSDMTSCELSAGQYAVFTHKGSLTDFKHTVDYIWGTWVPSKEYELRDAPDFELYDHRFSEDNLSGEIDIYIPVV